MKNIKTSHLQIKGRIVKGGKEECEGLEFVCSTCGLQRQRVIISFPKYEDDFFFAQNNR